MTKDELTNAMREQRFLIAEIWWVKIRDWFWSLIQKEKENKNESTFVD